MTDCCCSAINWAAIDWDWVLSMIIGVPVVIVGTISIAVYIVMLLSDVLDDVAKDQEGQG